MKKNIILLCLFFIVTAQAQVVKRLKDINTVTGGTSSNPTEFTNSNNQLFFVANNGVHGTELWITDGTESGTKMVKDINSNNNSGSNHNRFKYFRNNNTWR